MDIAAEKVKPYNSDERNKGEQVKEMFDNIAPAYDFMNRAMTFGIDKIWRRKAVDIIKKDCDTHKDTYRILDVATGTGDLAILMAKRLKNSHITGIDLSEGMVAIGREKVKKAGLEKRIALTTGDCLALPFSDNTFDCITVAYGVRNFEHLKDGYAEMLRTLKPGGMLCVIELSTPPSPLIKPFYSLYTRHIIPLVGRMVSKDVRAYSYLPESIAAVPQRKDMTDLISEVGFRSSSFRSLTFGVCTIYTARK